MLSYFRVTTQSDNGKGGTAWIYGLLFGCCHGRRGLSPRLQMVRQQRQ